MSKVENLEKIIDAFGPHLHDAPYGGWRADRVIDRIVPTHCPYCAVQCGMNLLAHRFSALLPLVVASGICFVATLRLIFWWRPASRRFTSSGYVKR